MITSRQTIATHFKEVKERLHNLTDQEVAESVGQFHHITADEVLAIVADEKVTCGNGCLCLTQCGDTYAHSGRPTPPTAR